MRSASDVPSPHPRADARGCLQVLGTLLAILALSFSGCDWLNRPAGNPRREGNFQDGLRWADQGRWDNARESYYRALETNPQNLHAHLALGDLYRSRLTNQVLALYHYHRFLELGRAQNNGDFREQSATDGIRNAEVELARGYAERMFRDQQQYELDNLRRTNAVLLQRIDVLTHHIGLLSRQVASQTNPLVAPPTDRPRTSLPESPAQALPTPQANRSTPQIVDPRRNAQTTPTQPAQPTQPTPTRTHRVAAGETLSTIARQYRIGVPALQSANPSVDARRLRQGQVLVIPPR
jgi:LysM repeat protein